MQYIGVLITGLIVGALAKLFYIGDNSNGWIMTMILGVAGSLLAGFLSSFRDGKPGVEIKPAGFLFSLIGAMLLIFIGKQFGLAL